MPSLSNSAVPRPTNMTRVASSPSSAATPPAPATNGRSAVMLASLPGLGSGPDAVLRQFGGNNVPTQRILVP